MTIQYYNQNADAFIQGTINVDMEDLYRPFINNLPKDALILDAGCGSGRDTKAFLDKGFKVKAIDASEAMVSHATSYSGIEVKQATFQNITDVDKYDGIWTCASLLHVPLEELPQVIGNLRRALKQGGVWYLSFKYGSLERIKDGRVFTDMNENTIKTLLSHEPDLEILDMWTTIDTRPERSEKWLNIIVGRC